MTRLAIIFGAALLVFVASVAAATRSTERWPPEGTHRYVSPSGDDDHDGSSRRPWRTIAHAAARVRPGDTVHVKPGTYRGPVTIARDGFEDWPIRFKSDRRWKARIVARRTDSVTVVDIRGDHIHLEGFDVTGAGADGTVGISVAGRHDAIVGNRVHDLSVHCRRAGNGGAGIVVGAGATRYRSPHALVDGNLVEDVGRGPRDGTCRLVHGIYAAAPRAAVVNNIVFNVVGDGITSWHAARQLTIANNLSALNGGAGILVGSGDSGASSRGHTRTLVANNIVYRNALYGVTESSDGVHPVGRGNRYLNNLAYANLQGDFSAESGVNGVSQLATVSGTLNADPGLLTVTKGGARRYRVLAASPAVDAGSPVGAPRRDFSMVPRPQGRQVDIGPYEQRRPRQVRPGGGLDSQR